MAAAIAGIFNHAMTAAQAMTGTAATPLASPATGAAGSSSNGSSSDSSSATISANDFLTLLVTEMKNQDPTANTDPNEYINQLVNVNSLEQLIDINQNLSAALGTPGSKAHSSTAITQAALPASTPAASAPATASPATVSPSSASPASALSALSSAAKRAPGNLTVPNALPAAKNVAHALDGRAHAQSAANRLPVVR